MDLFRPGPRLCNQQAIFVEQSMEYPLPIGHVNASVLGHSYRSSLETRTGKFGEHQVLPCERHHRQYFKQQPRCLIFESFPVEIQKMRRLSFSIDVTTPKPLPIARVAVTWSWFPIVGNHVYFESFYSRSNDEIWLVQRQRVATNRNEANRSNLVPNRTLRLSPRINFE
eukprot:scaffold4545_cov103-Alexandrium_tamarense.AAC.16